MNHILYQDGILKALPFKRLPWGEVEQSIETSVPKLWDERGKRGQLPRKQRSFQHTASMSPDCGVAHARLAPL